MSTQKCQGRIILALDGGFLGMKRFAAAVDGAIGSGSKESRSSLFAVVAQLHLR